ncbi:DUF4350 domain-containing protein [Lysobacter sp. LF1]|uniref:DUF4350 domain-containing protein n=1 Tax=Lysobacter stagni TaxID=3045172 RepID=A0ABT6XDP0_9GAMM|nr:DUF4350 domain-containing protein [Lysobacter sp. LF1]MDI9238252.1 DUF4350 domain-containing protein [Lysobacter sp. LF1]
MSVLRRPPLSAILAIAFVVAVAAAIAWWNYSFVRVEKSVEVPRTGEARSNPLYVLKLALRLDGVNAVARPRLQRDRVSLGPRDTVLIYSDPQTLMTADVDALLAWVEQGGHLLVRTPPGGNRADHGHSSLLSRFDIVPTAPGCAGLRVRGEDPHVEFCEGSHFRLSPASPTPLLQWRDERDTLAFARLRHGRGLVDVLADFDFLENDAMKDGPHVALARQLLAPNYRAGAVHLIYDAQVPSFWWTLLTRSWMAWAPLMLALLAWLWRRSQRFGPQLPAPASERRSLMEHIVASGEHVYRYGYAHLLHQAALDAFLARLRRRDPEAAALRGEPQVALLAQRLAMPPAEIRDALSTPIARDRAAFRQRVATLVRMRNSL